MTGGGGAAVASGMTDAIARPARSSTVRKPAGWEHGWLRAGPGFWTLNTMTAPDPNAVVSVEKLPASVTVAPDGGTFVRTAELQTEETPAPFTTDDQPPVLSVQLRFPVARSWQNAAMASSPEFVTLPLVVADIEDKVAELLPLA